jgi:hypothetical protein
MITSNKLQTVPILSLQDAKGDKRSQTFTWHPLPNKHELFDVIDQFFIRAFRTVPSFHQWPRSYNQIEYHHPLPKHGTRLFEGAIACSLMKEDLIELYSGTYTYVWSFKTEGVRYHCCFLKTDIKRYEKVVAFRDRFGHTFVIPCAFCPEQLFDGTLWDGEIVWTPKHNRVEYHIFGNIFTYGYSCAMMNKLSRVQIVQNVLEEWKMTLPCSYAPIDVDCERWVLYPFQIGAPIGFHVKPWYLLSQAALYRPLRAKLDYPTDPANILDPIEYPEIYGRHSRLYKRKDNISNTVDTHAREADQTRSPEKEMVVSGWSDGSNWKSESSIPLLALYTYSLEEKREKLFTYAEYPLNWPYELSESIVECEYSPQQSRWVIKCLRSDKKFPNDDITIQKTIRNIEENLAWEDICPFLKSPELKTQSLFYHDRSCIVYGSFENKLRQAQQDKAIAQQDKAIAQVIAQDKAMTRNVDESRLESEC